MCRKHTPTPAAVREAVSKAFNTTVEAIISESRTTDCVVPREVTAYLMQTRSLMTWPQIAIEIEKEERWTRRMIKHTIHRMRVDTDFAARVWEAEKILLGIIG